MIRRFFSTTKSKMRTKSMSSFDYCIASSLDDLERRKHIWKDETAAKSEFLLIKSSEEQLLSEDSGSPVDTVYVTEQDGLPILRAVFDVHHFHPDEVTISVDDSQLTMHAESYDDTDCSVFKKTMRRNVQLPINVDKRRMQTSFTEDGRLRVEMPFHVSPIRRPSSSSMTPETSDTHGLVPIYRDPCTGSRHIRLYFRLGPDFATDDVSVDVTGATLDIVAAYGAEIGAYGTQVIKREIRRQVRLPAGIDVDRTEHRVTFDGNLLVLLVLGDRDDDDSCQYRVTTLSATKLYDYTSCRGDDYDEDNDDVDSTTEQ